ncbi:MAG TPA: ComEC/Rec2 family competence protein, partial [Candidatus Dormibacteraeota bacterium]|nr:ComEC/Rec2 family competence protein [Candidatus Dormibacteraeota bacterium]
MTTALACLLAGSAGIAVATVALPGSPGVGLAAVLGAVLAAAAGAVGRWPRMVPLAVAACLLGVARAEVPAGDPTAAARAPALAGQQAVVDGRVADDPRLLAGGVELLVTPGSLATAAGPTAPAGAVVAFVRGTPDVAIGDRVQVAGRLDLPRDQPDFDRRAYVAQRGAYLEIRSASLTVEDRAGGLRALPGWLRDHYRRAIVSLVPPPHAEVLVGIVLGIRTGVPPRLEQDLVATGLVHLLVLSGLKVAVFSRLVTGVLAPALGRFGTVPALALIALYALAGGATPAAVRAATMGGIVLVAAHLGRPAHLWTSLAATGAAMLVWRPELAWDVGFQLSFFGTAAIVLLTPGVERRLSWMPGWLREPFAVTLAAQVGTVPLMAADFHVLSPVAPVANAAVLPLLPAMVGAGLLVAPLAAVPEVGRIAALPLTGVLAYLEQVASVLARAPAAAIPVPALPPGMGVAYYAAVGGAVAAAHSEGRLRRVAVAAGLLVPLAVGGAELAAWSRPAPAATVLAVGAGQAVLLSGPGGWVLIDGGSSPARLADELGGRLPPWQHRLAGLVITGPGIGHVGGLVGLAYPAATVLVPDGNPAGSAWRTAALAEAARGARVAAAHAGQTWWLAGLRLDVLSPEPDPPEPEQLAFRVTGPGGVSFCDLADLDLDGQAAAALRLAGRCDALLLPDGGRSAPAADLLAAARPDRLIASDAGGQLARTLPRGAVSRTSEEGAIV